MPVLSHTDLKSPKGRLLLTAIYLLLILGGLTMIYPFMVMVTGSMGTGFDYERRSALPRHFRSREDRFLRALCLWFPPSHRASIRQLRSLFPGMPESWQTWAQIGDDTPASDAWAQRQLETLKDPEERARMETAAGDYGDFMADWDLKETILAFDMRHVAPFLRERYGTLERFNAAWEVSIDDFAKATAPEWSGEPIDQQGYLPLADTRYLDLLAFRQAYRDGRYTPYLSGRDSPAGCLRPASLRYLWEEFAAAQIKLADPVKLRALPFPVSPQADPTVRAAWEKFLLNSFPLRHIAIEITPTRRRAFRQFLVRRFRSLEYMNRVLESRAADWDALTLTPTVPPMPAAKVWMDFVKTDVPVRQWRIRSTLPERAFQEFALHRHGSLEAVNRAYGLKLASIQQLPIPLKESVLVTFARRGGDLFRDGVLGNYAAVVDYFFQRGQAVRNTVILVLLSLLVTLTVNPLAGYALSRFRLRASEKVIVFCLATTAFPAAVAAIPGFLLLRDMGLLNTFAALVLPGAANGMTIFLLKGFFDSLPKELYEAAAIDGAPEWVVLTRISLPLVKPILAVSLLNSFIAAYNGWEWAIIVCQDPRVWTVAVWTYQFHQTLSAQPYTVMAAFIINSIPVLLVFLFCQKIILRGIILPQMK